MYLSNRLPMANYDFKGKKNLTVKLSKSINGKNTYKTSLLNDSVVMKGHRNSVDVAEAPSSGDVKPPNKSGSQVPSSYKQA